MTHKCTRRFSYSEDGVTPIAVALNEIVEVPADILDGLIAEGFLGDPDGPDVAVAAVANEIEAPTGGPDETKIVTPEELKAAALEDEKNASKEADAVEYAELAAAYLKAAGKKPHGQWSLATLRQKLIEV